MDNFDNKGRDVCWSDIDILAGDDPSNTWFSGPTQVLNPKGSSIGAAVFAGLTSVTDRPTDDANRSVRIGRIYVRSTVMRPNNVYISKRPHHDGALKVQTAYVKQLYEANYHNAVSVNGGRMVETAPICHSLTLRCGWTDIKADTQVVDLMEQW